LINFDYAILQNYLAHPTARPRRVHTDVIHILSYSKQSSNLARKIYSVNENGSEKVSPVISQSRVCHRLCPWFRRQAWRHRMTRKRGNGYSGSIIGKTTWSYRAILHLQMLWSNSSQSVTETQEDQ